MQATSAKILVTNHFRKHLSKWGYFSKRNPGIIKAHHYAKLSTVVFTPRSMPRRDVSNTPWQANSGWLSFSERVAWPLRVSMVEVIK